MNNWEMKFLNAICNTIRKGIKRPQDIFNQHTQDLCSKNYTHTQNTERNAKDIPSS